MDRHDHGMSLEAVSVVVATAGRIEPLRQLLESLAEQTHPLREVIVIAQGQRPLAEGELGHVWPFPLRHIHFPDQHGGCRARNIGWRQAEGNWLLFPDEQCRYPPGYTAQALGLARRHEAEIVTGRAADLAGMTLGRFEPVSGWISRRTVLTSQAEWNVLIQHNAMRQLGGFDETVSPGGEGYDLLLRAVALDIACRYEPHLIAHREEGLPRDRGGEHLRRGRDHARGLGRVLARHGFGMTGAAYWIARSAINLGLSAATLRRWRSRYYLHQLAGRLEGFFDCSLPIPPYPREISEQTSCRSRTSAVTIR